MSVSVRFLLPFNMLELPKLNICRSHPLWNWKHYRCGFCGEKSKYSPGCLSTINYFEIFMIWLKNSTVFWLGEGIICVSGLMYLWHWSLSDFIKNRIFLVVLVMPNINVRLEAKHFVYLLSLHSLCGRTILLGLPSSVVVFLLFMLYTNRNYISCLLLSFAFVNFYVRVLLTL